jgi:hypothetical protein
MRRWILFVVLSTAGCAGAPRTALPTTDAPSGGTGLSPVERLLEASDIASVVDQRARVFTRQVAILVSDLSDEELGRLVPAVQQGFAAELLRGDVATFIESEATEGRIDDVLAWLEGGATAEARQRVSAYTPPLSLQDWLTEYTDDPPSEERVRLIARWTEAGGEGDFFVLLDEALAEAAFAVRGVLRPGSPEFAPIQGGELRERLERSFGASVLATLHESETVPDDVVRAAITELDSEAGRWYVLTWQLAVAEAVRSAGRRVVASLAG